MLLHLGYGISAPSFPKTLSGDSVIVLFGDSLEAHNGYATTSAGSEEFSNWSRGYYNWCHILDPRGPWVNWYDATKTGRYFQGTNQGISGNTTTQMVARKADVYNVTGVKIVVQGGGTNDINQGDSVATILANHANCIAEWKSRGIKTVLMTPPPRSLEGTNSWAAGSAERLAWFDLCDGTQALADADPDWVQIVRRDLICGNNDANRTPKTGYLNVDNVHLNPIGGYHVAADSGGLIEKLSNWIEPSTDFPAAAQAGDITTNPTLSGTGGSVSTGCTGVAPTGMRFRRSSGSYITAVGSKETINGEEYFKIVVTRNGSGGTETISLDYNGNITAGLPAVGTWVRAAMKAKWNASAAIQNVLLQARQQPSTPANMNNYTMRVDSGYPWENVAIAAADGSGLWQMGPPMVIKSGITSILYNALITVDNSTAGTDTIWISRMHLYSVDDPRTSLGFA
ncbi:MAG: GDSL-type esterase/lipase family protein [Pseudobdellovibrionaceae bacterium]